MAPANASWAAAEWVGGGNQLRSEFTLRAAPVSATLMVRKCHSPCVATAFVGKTLPLPCAFNCLRGQGSAFALCFNCLRG